MKLIPAPIARIVRRLASDERGLTLIEVMATALIVALLAAATATALITTAKASGHEQFRSEADSLASQDLDQMRGLSDAQLYAIQNGTARSHSVQLGGITFKVTSTAKFGSATNATGCSASSASYYETTSTVTWSENGVMQSVSENSLLSRPVYGTLVVNVQDPSGNALSGVTITAYSASNSSGQVEQQSSLTNAAGCVQFAGLDAGSYTISASEAGYVDVNGNGNSSSSPSQQTVTVASSGTTANFTLAQASGPITATLTTTKTGAAAEADGLAWSTATMASPGFNATAAGTTAKSQTSSNTLYPGAYSVWAGRCLNQEPPSTPSPSYLAGTTVSAGGSSSVTIDEPMLSLPQVNYVVPGSGNSSSTTSVAPAHVVFTFSGGVTSTGAACFDSWAATVASVNTGSGGWLANPGQPYAPSGYPLTVCVDYKPSGSSTYYYASTTVTNTNFTAPASIGTMTITKGTNSGQCAVRTS